MARLRSGGAAFAYQTRRMKLAKLRFPKAMALLGKGSHAGPKAGNPIPFVRVQASLFVTYVSNSGTNSTGKFWKLTGRRKRRIDMVPTDVAPKFVEAGYGPP